MSATRNQAAPRAQVQRRLIDVVSGPRNTLDPRNVRSTQQAMASRLSGDGLVYDSLGRLALDRSNLSLYGVALEGDTAQLDQALSELAARGYYGRLISSDATEVSTNNTAAEFTWAEHTIPSGVLVDTHAARMVSHGYIFNNTGGAVTLTVKVKLGGTTHYEDVTLSIPASANLRGFLMDVTYSAEDDFDAQNMHGTVFIGDASAPTTGYGSLNAAALLHGQIGNGGGTKDMRTDQDLAFDLTMSTASATYIVYHHGSYLIAY